MPRTLLHRLLDPTLLRGPLGVCAAVALLARPTFAAGGGSGAGGAGPSPAPGEVRSPHVVNAQGTGNALVVRPEAVYTSDAGGLRAWPRPPSRAPARRFGPTEGLTDGPLVVDERFVYALADGKLWRSSIPGRGPADAKPRALADTGETVALAADPDPKGALYFPAADRMQVFRLARDGGTPLALVTSGAEAAVQSSNQRASQGIVTDGAAIYWTFEGKLVRVDKAGGVARVLVRAPDLVGPSLAVDGERVYFGRGGKTYRALKADGGDARVVLDAEAQMIRVRGDMLFVLTARDLVRVPRDGGAPESLDDCPLPKTAFDVAGDFVVWADQWTGFQEAGIFELPLAPATPAVLSGPASNGARTPARGKISNDEAARAVRVWIRDLRERREPLPSMVPVHVRLERGLGEDDYQVERDLRTPAELRDFAEELRDHEHDLLTFSARCPAWKAPTAATRKTIAAAGPKAARAAAAPGETTIVNHRNAQCSYGEVIARVKRAGDAVVPTFILYTTGYDCE